MLSVIDDALQLTESEIRRFRDAVVWIEGLEPGADAVHRDVPSFSPLWLLSRRRATALAAARIAPLAVNCYRCDTPVPDSSRYCHACGADVSGGGVESRVAVERDPELEEKLAAELEGEFVIERLLGRGGMALVFLAHDLHLERRVAIKVLPPELTFGPGTVARFKREARTSATLDHPHIVPIFRISTGGKLVWFAMKYIDGETLADVLERERTLSLERSVAILTQVAEALEFAHEHGVIHRDVKPANVMVDHNGWVTVTDFGIAKATDMQPLTGSGAMIGTPFYMSPEQCAGKRNITGATDQYSLAVMAYQMVTGRLPFVGQSTVDIIKQHCFDVPPPITSLRPNLPPGLSAIVGRALAKSPEDRFTSITQFARAFTSSVRGEAITVQLPTRPRITERRWRRLILSLLGGAATIGIGAVILWSQRQRQANAGETPVVALPQSDSVIMPKDAELVLFGVNRGATIGLDGKTVGDSILRLRPGERHIVTVSLPGYETWSDTLTPTQSGRDTVTVVLRKGRPSVVPPAREAPGTGYLTFATNPPDVLMRINGRTISELQPIDDMPVPAGLVQLHFEVFDSSGGWPFDTSVVVAAGKQRNLGRIHLKKRP